MKLTKFTPAFMLLALVVGAVGLFNIDATPIVAVLGSPESMSLASLGAVPFIGLDTENGDLKEIKRIIEEQGRAWEEFKTTHEQQIAELKKGRNDPLVEEKLTKLSARLDELQAQKDELEKKFNRPALVETDESRAEAKALRRFNLELKAAALVNGRQVPADIGLEQYRGYKNAFESFMRKGDRQLDDAERKALSVGVDSDGGYLVPADMSGRIVQKLYDLSPIRQIANVQAIGSDRLEGIEDTGEADAGWVGETGTRSDTTTPTVGKYEIPAHEMYAQPKATQKLLDDAAVDVDSWLSGKVSDKLARVEGAGFVNGNGVAKPRGFASYPTAATADASRAWGTLEHVKSGANGAFAATNPGDVLFELESAFKPGYLAGATWVTRRSVLVLIRKFKDGQGQYLWQPGLQAGKPAQLIGYPITMAEDMPAIATGSLSLSLGNFTIGYQIVDRLGIRVLRDPYTDKPYVKFYTTKRTGGAVVNFESIKFIQFSA